MRIFGVFAIVFAATGIPVSGPAHAHGPYSTWKRPVLGTSCCSDQDCRPVELCDHGRGLALDGQCVPIDWATVINEPSPDGRTHACWITMGGKPNVLCVVLEGAS